MAKLTISFKEQDYRFLLGMVAQTSLTPKQFGHAVIMDATKMLHKQLKKQLEDQIKQEQEETTTNEEQQHGKQVQQDDKRDVADVGTQAADGEEQK